MLARGPQQAVRLWAWRIALHTLSFSQSPHYDLSFIAFVLVTLDQWHADIQDAMMQLLCEALVHMF